LSLSSNLREKKIEFRRKKKVELEKKKFEFERRKICENDAEIFCNR
jgi:hypothetical protein